MKVVKKQNLKTQKDVEEKIINFVNIEAIRVDAASDLKIINEYLDIINNLEKGSEEISSSSNVITIDSSNKNYIKEDTNKSIIQDNNLQTNENNKENKLKNSNQI